jgi:DNA polymerase-3 subunit gamma/tau
MLLIQLDGQELLDITPESLQVSASQAEQISASALLAAIKRFSQAENELKGGWQPQLPLELALVEMIVKSDGEAGAAMLAEPTPAPVGTKTGKSVPDGTSSRTTVATAPAPLSQDVPEEDDPDELTLSLVQQRWGEVLESARAQDRSVQALLNSTRPHRVQGQTVTLQVAHEFARSKLSEGRARRLVEEVMTQVFDQPCRVEYELSAFDEIPTGAEWDDDPVVQAARQMGAKVRPIDEGRK